MVIMEEKAWDACGIRVHVNHLCLQNYTIGTRRRRSVMFIMNFAIKRWW